jgi:tetratricopeptide (TPR) repeat protein
VANAIHTQFSRDANMGLLPQSGVRDRLEYLGILPYDPYGLPPSPFDIAKAVRADYLVMGELNRAGGAYSLQTQLYSASKNRVVQSDSQVFQGGLPELLGRLPALVEKLGQNIAAASKTYAPPASAPKPSVKKDASTIKQAAPVNPEYPAPAPPPDSTNASAKMQQELDALQQHVRDLRESLEAQVRQTQMHKEQSESNRAELDALRMELEAERQRRERAAAEVAPMRKAADIAKAAKAAGEAKISGLSPEQIVAKLRLAVGLDPSVADYHIDLAKTLYATGAYDAALEACGIGIGHHALDATLLILKGACYFSKADGIVKSRPRGDAMAMSHASMLFAMAEEAYRQARAADPDNAYAQYNLALTIQTSDTDNSRVIQALREWDRYFALAQGDPEQAEWMKMAREIKKPLDAASP